MQLFYNADLDENLKSLTFDKEESRHIVRVLRKKEGDLLTITNGKNTVFTAKITLASDKKCQVQIIDFVSKEPLRKYKLSIAIAPTKSNDRTAWFLEKATEIGLDEIFPILCEHSERKIIKTDRLSKALLTAMKQSLQFQLPKLHELTTLKELILNPFSGQKFIAYCEENKSKALQNIAQAQKDTLLLIGPEGGFSPEEIALALANGFIPVSLGATRLRTETAGIVAVHTINLVNNRN